jgi:hypothetical protein
MPRTARRALLALCAVALAALFLAAVAGAATVTLKCGGKGGRNESSDGTKICAALPGKARTLEGVLRDDQNKPVDGKLSVTFSEWIPQGDGSFSVEPYKTVTVSANAAGKFAIPVKTTSEVSVAVETVADEKKSISGGAVAGAAVQLELQTTVKKLGGGRVQVTVKGTKQPLKIAITEEYGYEVSGGKLKKAKNGVASFNLGAARGTLEVYVEAGALSDLFWPVRPSFKL